MPGFAALAGLAVGSTSSLLAMWLTQISTSRVRRIGWQQKRLETLYAEFLEEASRVHTHALSNPSKHLSGMVTLYAILSHMRLFAPKVILEHAQRIVDYLINAYSVTNSTFVELQTAVKERHTDLLDDFSNACRRNLFHTPMR